jgi:hypothetical protein
MAAHGGNRWSQGIALFLVSVSSGIALSACEYQDAGPAPSDALGVVSAPAPEAGPSTGISPPVPPPPPKVDPTIAHVQARNGAQLDRRLGLAPDGVVMGGSGGLANDGFRSSAHGIPKGSYTITAECVGVPKASLTVFQSDRRGGTTHEVSLDCGTTARTKLDLEAGPVSVHITRMTTEPGLPAVAGFWMVPAA